VFEAFGYEVGYTSGMVALEKNLEASGSEALEFEAFVEFTGKYRIYSNAISPTDEPKRKSGRPIASTQLPLAARVVPTQSLALSQSTRH
jgi:hypothetical protein